MKRPFVAAFYSLALLAIFISAINTLRAAPSPHQLFPLIQAQLSGPSIVTLTESDTTFVSAAYDAAGKRIYVSYIDRAHGNRAHFTELIGDQLHDIALPAFPSPAAAPAAPAFTPPDSPKDADSALLAIDGWVYWFVTSREEDIAGAPFKLKLMRFRP